MGACLCKGQAAEGDSGDAPDVGNAPEVAVMASSSDSSEPKRPRISEEETLEQLILEILEHTTNIQESNEPPPTLPRLTALTTTDEGWCNLALALIRTIPMDHILGSTAVGLIFEHCPPPARDTAVEEVDLSVQFILSLNLNPSRCGTAYTSLERTRRERNLLHILACIIEKFASQNTSELLTDDVIEYLISFLALRKDKQFADLSLAALVALLKLCQTPANKTRVAEALAGKMLNPLLLLEIHATSKNYRWRCVGFLARWALDYLFLVPKRPLSYRIEDTSNIRVMLNVKETTGHLRVSPNGLEVRCDSYTFESVRGTFEVRRGCFYYEVELVTAGMMQIGWAAGNAKSESYCRVASRRLMWEDGFGVGDDRFSVGYDGCRRLLWHEAKAHRVDMRSWRAGDVLGCLIDTATGVAVFSLNGKLMPPFQPAFLANGYSCYPAASFRAGQQCIFNFGARAFAFSPHSYYHSCMNEHGNLNKDEKLTVHRRQEKAKPKPRAAGEPEPGGRCVSCLEPACGFIVDPCQHGEFCSDCVMSVEECPVCHVPVVGVHVART